MLIVGSRKDDPYRHHQRGGIPTSLVSGPRGTFLTAQIQCSCGWSMSLEHPASDFHYGDRDAERDLNDSWESHVSEVTPAQPGEELYAGSFHAEGTSVYWGAIRSRETWRRNVPLWTCSHGHDSESDAIACAEDELIRRQPN